MNVALFQLCAVELFFFLQFSFLILYIIITVIKFLNAITSSGFLFFVFLCMISVGNVHTPILYSLSLSHSLALG